MIYFSEMWVTMCLQKPTVGFIFISYALQQICRWKKNHCKDCRNKTRENHKQLDLKQKYDNYVILVVLLISLVNGAMADNSIQRGNLFGGIQPYHDNSKTFDYIDTRSLSSSLTCVDNQDFRDFVGLDCKQHAKTPDCSKIWIVGYSFTEVENILRNCPLSCKLCDSSIRNPSITPKVGATELALPTNSPTVEPTPICHDSKKFRDRLGLKCSSHSANRGCNKLALVGYSRREIEQLKRRCKRSCGYCRTASPTAKPSLSMPKTSCHDDKTYLDHLGLSCNRFSVEVCDNVIVLGYTLKQSKELNSRCPFSCGRCDTAVPSHSPSATSSNKPSGTPTIHSSNTPTENPSINPTALPTVFPTIIPTVMPTPNCHDNSSFQDKRDFTCGQHKFTPDCAKLGVLGYSREDMVQLMQNCPMTCNLCESSSPSTFPSYSNVVTFEPTPVPTYEPTSFCNDNMLYRDPLGSSCFRYEELVCENMNVLGFTATDILTLINNCPKACGLCVLNTRERPSVNPEMWQNSRITPHSISIVENTDRPTLSLSKGAMGGPSSIPTFSPTNHTEILSTNRPTIECTDDPTYKDRLGLTCVDHQRTIKCSEVASIGYTKKEVEYLMISCKFSCNLCTSIPSFVPMEFIPSFVPMETPSNSPTFQLTQSSADTSNMVTMDSFQINLSPFSAELSKASLEKFHLACDELLSIHIGEALSLQRRLTIATKTLNQKVNAVFSNDDRESSALFALDIDMQKTFFYTEKRQINASELQDLTRFFFEEPLQNSKLMLFLSAIDPNLYSEVETVSFVGYLSEMQSLELREPSEAEPFNVVEDRISSEENIILIASIVGAVFLLVIVVTVFVLKKKISRKKGNKSSRILEEVSNKARRKLHDKESTDDSDDTSLDCVDSLAYCATQLSPKHLKVESGHMGIAALKSESNVSTMKSEKMESPESADTEDTQKTSNCHTKMIPKTFEDGSCSLMSTSSEIPNDGFTKGSGIVKSIEKAMSDDVPELTQIAEECSKRIGKKIEGTSKKTLEDLYIFKKKDTKLVRALSTTTFERPLLRDVLGTPNAAIPLKNARSATSSVPLVPCTSPPSPPPLNSLRDLDKFRSQRKSPRLKSTTPTNVRDEVSRSQRRPIRKSINSTKEDERQMNAPNVQSRADYRAERSK